MKRLSIDNYNVIFPSNITDIQIENNVVEPMQDSVVIHNITSEERNILKEKLCTWATESGNAVVSQAS